MNICLVAIFKNESEILNEWIQHYIRQGVDHFLLIDNGSSDNYMEILLNYSNITLVIDSTPHIQKEHYNNYFLEKSKEYEWVIVCDLDEFMYARLGFNTIKDYLLSLDDTISQILIPWKIFGSSGYNTIDKKQPLHVVSSFTKRTNYDKSENCQGVIMDKDNKYGMVKSIIKTKYLIKFDIHTHITSNMNWIGSDKNNYIYSDNNFYKIDEQILANSYIHINHYPIQSFEWFMRIKATRGAANTHDNCRDETYFKEFDDVSNDIDDFELAEQFN
jgi:hypothetical protein